MTRADKLAKRVGLDKHHVRRAMLYSTPWVVKLWNLCLRLMEDKERLDWLQSDGAAELYGGVWYVWNEKTDGENHLNRNLRKAIDRARRKP